MLIKKEDAIMEIMKVAEGERYLVPVLEALDRVPPADAADKVNVQPEFCSKHYERLCQVVDTYGNLQYLRAVEELGELITLLGRLYVKQVSASDLVEEIADCYNMLDQLCILLNVEDITQNMAEYKMLRTIQRMQEEEGVVDAE